MGFVEIKLDKMRNFKYGMRALDRIEKKLRKKVANIDMSTPSMEELAIVMWAGLVHEDNSLTPERVMDLVDQYSNIKDVSKKLSEAMEAAYGKEEEGEKNE